MDKQTRTQAEALFFQGTRYMESGDSAAAEASFKQAIELISDFAEAYVNLGLLLEQRDAVAAEACYRQALKLNSAYPQIYLNLGALLAGRKRFDEAEAAYQQAILLNAESPVGWSNLGVLYACMKREAEAEQCYRTAISLDADYSKARFNLSYLLLRQGKFEEGWHCLEARNWYTGLSEHLDCPRWQGEPLQGKAILISHEAGHGDVIQFCRYAAVLKVQGALSVTLICHPALKALLAELESVDAIISFDEPVTVSGWDFWTPLLSIPYHCHTRFDSIPAAIPYLRAPPDRLEKWSQLLLTEGLRVGLVWKGSTQFENDADRSLPSLDVLAPLGKVAGITFFSLQKGAGEEEALHPPIGLNLIPFGTQLEDFADTAAVVSNLDLVICVDTAVAHLAGALGVPCWILLPEYMTDWRWLKDRTDSPWYPTMRLFRQRVMGNWDAVIAEIVVALEQMVSPVTA